MRPTRSASAPPPGAGERARDQAAHAGRQLAAAGRGGVLRHPHPLGRGPPCAQHRPDARDIFRAARRGRIVVGPSGACATLRLGRWGRAVGSGGGSSRTGGDGQAASRGWPCGWSGGWSGGLSGGRTVGRTRWVGLGGRAVRRLVGRAVGSGGRPSDGRVCRAGRRAGGAGGRAVGVGR